LDKKDYTNELNIIKYLAESNGYNKTIVSKLLHKTKNKQQTKTKADNKYITLTYINNHTERITHKFKKQDLKLYTEPQKKLNSH
ncbi:MAG: hypothetical protein ACTS4X_01625, partial [Candidatus Hodgkinia cicadicola]